MEWLYYGIAASLFWGLSYSICGEILKSISTTSLIFIEMLFGLLVFSVFIFFNNPHNDILAVSNNKRLFFLVLLEIIVFIFGNYLAWQTVKMAPNPGIAALIESTYPLFAIIFSYIFFRVYDMNIYTIIGGLLVLLGIFIIRLQ
jgi:drug/metabolite transporter (DMT)-like permease